MVWIEFLIFQVQFLRTQWWRGCIFLCHLSPPPQSHVNCIVVIRHHRSGWLSSRFLLGSTGFKIIAPVMEDFSRIFCGSWIIPAGKTGEYGDYLVPPGSLLFFPHGSRCNVKVTMATITKIITSHFAIPMVKPAIPFMPIMKNTRARIRKMTAR